MNARHYLLLPLFLTVAISGGCRWVGGYLGDRTLDFLDIWSGGWSIGFGAEANLQATRFCGLGAGYSKNLEHWGFRGREWGYWDEDRYDLNLGIALLGRTDIKETGGSIEPFKNLDDQYFTWGDGGRPLFRCELALHLLIFGLNFGVDPGQMVDCVAGVFLLDPYGDDYYLSHRAAREDLLEHLDIWKARAQGKDEEAVDLALLLLDDPDLRARRAAMTLLVILRLPEATESLGKRLSSASEEEISLAAEALARLQTPAASALLRQAATTGEIWRRRLVLAQVLRVERLEFGSLFEAAAKTPGLEEIALRGLKSQGTPAMLPLLPEIGTRLEAEAKTDAEKEAIRRRLDEVRTEIETRAGKP